MFTVRLHSILHEYLGTDSLGAHQNEQPWPTMLQIRLTSENFSYNQEYFFVSPNRLPVKDFETLKDIRSKKQEPRTLNQTNSKSALAKLSISRANHARPAATIIHHPAYNMTYLDNPREIAEALGKYFISSLTINLQFCIYHAWPRKHSQQVLSCRKR